MMAGALAATGWRLEKLVAGGLDLAQVAALVAAPTFALRELEISRSDLGPAALRTLAAAPWPLERVKIGGSIHRSAECGPPLATLSRHAGLRELVLVGVNLGPRAVRALLDAEWPALTKLELDLEDAEEDEEEDNEEDDDDDFVFELGAASFAGFPRLEVLRLTGVWLGVEGARALAARPWACLRDLKLHCCELGDTGAAALARGKWAALERLNVTGENGIGEAGARALAALALRLESNALGDAGAAALARGE